jgi:tripartite-type tricarboxylate transporter receptor subunit TctC
MSDDDVKKRLVSGGMDPLMSKSPEDFASFLAAEAKRWATVVQESGATPD